MDKQSENLRLRQWPTISILALGVSLVAGCAAVDTVSPRANTFNQQTADAKSASILTNIVRAAYAEPLQFTELSGSSGQGSLAGSVNSTVPFPFRGGTGTLPLQIIGGSFGAQGSVANSFSMANQNTQEFYQGIQKPVPQQLIFSYMAEGFDPQILLNLFVSDIELIKNGRSVLIPNDPDDPGSWNNFYSAVNWLARSGLEGEKISETTTIGPELSSSAARDPRLLSALIAAPAGSPSLEGEGGTFHLVKHDASYRYCFRTDASQIVLSYRGGKPDPHQTILLNRGDHCGASAKERAIKNAGFQIRLRTRSVEGAILYLGSLVRNQWGLGGGKPNPFKIPHSDGSYYTVFKLDRGVKAGHVVDVWYRGQTYGISGDPKNVSDGSSRVMQLLTDALALQSSAKDIPAPSVVTLLGP